MQFNSYETYTQWWVQQTNFRQAVTDIVNSEMFWRNFAQSSEMQRELNKIPTTVHNTIQTEMATNIKPQVESLTKSLIVSEIIRQLPGIIAQNNQFTNLFNDHKMALDNKLHAAVTKILDDIVGDPNYHTVTERYLNAITVKGDKCVAEIKAAAALTQANISSQWENLKRQINSDVQTQLSSISSLNTKIDDMRREYDNFKQNLFIVSMGVFAVVTLGFGLYVGYKK